MKSCGKKAKTDAAAPVPAPATSAAAPASKAKNGGEKKASTVDDERLKGQHEADEGREGVYES